MSVNESVFKTIEELEQKLAELRKIVGMAEIVPAAGAAAKSKSKKPKKEKEEGGEGAVEKEKRAPTAWNIFCVRVGKLIGKDGANLGLGAPLSVVGHIMAVESVKEKTAENLNAITDERILEIARALKPDDLKKERDEKAAVKKAKKEASEAGSVGEAEETTEAAPAEAVAAKPKRTLSEEQKAKMAAGRAAKKAEKEAAKAAPAEAPAEAVAEPAPAPKPAEAKAEPAKAAEAPAKKVGKVLKKAEPKKVDLRFRAWVHEGTNYYKNERGDVIDEALSWVGRYSEELGDINMDIEAPEDLGDVELVE